MSDSTSAGKPVDLTAVAADNAVIDALSAARLTDNSDEVFRILAAWHDHVDAQPIPELVSAAEAAAVIQAAGYAAAAAQTQRRERWWALFVTLGVALVMAIETLALVVFGVCR